MVCSKGVVTIPLLYKHFMKAYLRFNGHIQRENEAYSWGTFNCKKNHCERQKQLQDIYVSSKNTSYT